MKNGQKVAKWTSKMHIYSERDKTFTITSLKFGHVFKTLFE